MQNPKILKALFATVVACLFVVNAHAQSGTRLEAEDAAYTDCELIEESKYSGGKALELTANSARITFTYQAPEKGKYTLYVGYDALYGAKMVNVAVNGGAGSFQTGDKVMEEAETGTFIMDKGDNTIVITPGWTWFRIDYIRIASASSTIAFDISAAPVDAQASEPARKIYAFLYKNFGKKTISGMMTGDMTTANGDVTQHADVQAVYKVSGKYPALVGFDFMNATGLHAAESWYSDYTTSSVQLAKDTYRRGGIPAFTWHWRDPSHGAKDAFYTEDCSFKISSALNADGSWNTSSASYAAIIRDVDIVADHFLSLQEAGVACIFRPLHEASGKWFWWGADGAENCVRLYRLLFDEMVNVKGVHNLIWVWNAGPDDQAWNPGDDLYDIVSADIYNDDFDYSSNYSTFDKLKTLTGGKKIIALSENGPIPDIDKEFDEEAVWSWWMPWYQTWEGYFVDKTSPEQWKKCMDDQRVVTLEDLSAGWDAYDGISALTTDTNTYQDFFDLQGHRLSKPTTKGIYIQGRKKILVK